MGEALQVRDEELERLRQIGRGNLVAAKELQKLERQIQGLSWGTQMSAATRQVAAEFCRLTRANPLTHIDNLGGKIYLNASYWSDLVSQQERLHHFDQRDISPSVEAEMRERAAALHKRAGEIEAGDKVQAAKWRGMAYELEDEANEIKGVRTAWNPRPTATCVVETAIFRFINAAPMDAIRRGEIKDLTPYIVVVRECNWAGGMGQTMAASKKYDPIGDANPGTTARTRSLRRAASKAFSAWMEAYDKQIRKAEEIIEGEWEIIAEDQQAEQALLPKAGEQQAVRTGGGEPSAARAEDAQELPVEGQEAAVKPAKNAAPAPAGGDKTFDFANAKKRLFATLRDAGITEPGRKLWAKDNKLPESTANWNSAHYEKAFELLTKPVKDMVLAALPLMGISLEDLSLRILQKAAPNYLKDWLALQTELDRMAQAGSTEAAADPALDL